MRNFIDLLYKRAIFGRMQTGVGFARHLVFAAIAAEAQRWEEYT